MDKRTPLIEQGLVPSVWGYPFDASCQNEKCNNSVTEEDDCFIDTWGGPQETPVYCASCGPCLRYHRKKAEERGDDPQLATFP